MTEDREESCHVAQTVTGAHAANVVEAEEKSCKEYRDCRLEHVADQRQKSRLLSKGAEHICSTGISATVLAHVVAVNELRYDDSRVDASEKVGYRNNEHRGNYGKSDGNSLAAEFYGVHKSIL